MNQSELVILGTQVPSPFHSQLHTTGGTMSFETKPRHRNIYTACVCIAAVSIFGLLATTLRTLKSPLYPLVDEERESGRTSQMCLQTANHLDPINYLNGPPTDRFRGSLSSMDLKAPIEDLCLTDNLRPETKYITSWISAGWSTYRLTVIFCISELIPSYQQTML